MALFRGVRECQKKGPDPPHWKRLLRSPPWSFFAVANEEALPGLARGLEARRSGSDSKARRSRRRRVPMRGPHRARHSPEGRADPEQSLLGIPGLNEAATLRP